MRNGYSSSFFFTNALKQMNVCNYCNTEHEYLFDIFNPDYSCVLFRVCHECNIKAFLCPKCLNLRDRDEEYVNGIASTKPNI